MLILRFVPGAEKNCNQLFEQYDSTFVEYAPPVTHIAYFALYVKFCTSKKTDGFCRRFFLYKSFVDIYHAKE